MEIDKLQISNFRFQIFQFAICNLLFSPTLLVPLVDDSQTFQS
jgi:hypothetical protein